MRIHLRGLSQDWPAQTQEFVRQWEVRFPVDAGEDWWLSAACNPETVPALWRAVSPRCSRTFVRAWI